MFCTKCGQEVDEEDVRCPNCKHRIKKGRTKKFIIAIIICMISGIVIGALSYLLIGNSYKDTIYEAIEITNNGDNEKIEKFIRKKVDLKMMWFFAEYEDELEEMLEDDSVDDVVDFIKSKCKEAKKEDYEDDEFIDLLLQANEGAWKDITITYIDDEPTSISNILKEINEDDYDYTSDEAKMARKADKIYKKLGIKYYRCTYRKNEKDRNIYIGFCKRKMLLIPYAQREEVLVLNKTDE